MGSTDLRDTMLCGFPGPLVRVDYSWLMVQNFGYHGCIGFGLSPVIHKEDVDSNGSYLVGLGVAAAMRCSAFDWVVYGWGRDQTKPQLGTGE